MIRKTTKSAILFFLFLGSSLAPVMAQDCTGCTTAPMSGTVDFNGNSVICIPDGSTVTPQNINGANNVLCVPAGSTWNYGGTNMNVNNKALTIVVNGTLRISSSSQVTFGAARINVEAGGEIIYEGASQVVFHNTEVNNRGDIRVTNLETAETNFFTNFSTGRLVVNGRWYQHGGLINSGQIETLCGVSAPGTPGYPNLPGCEFLVGDKGSLYFENTGTIKVTGKVTAGGEIRNTCTGEILVNGNIDISKAILGNGTLVATTGTVTGDGGVRSNGPEGGCGTTQPTVFIESTPGHDFNTNTPSTPGNNNYTVSSSNPMPVKLIRFNAEVEGGQVNLTWSTSEEENSAYFQVQKSKDMRTWTAVGEVYAAGNSLTVQNYSFTEANEVTGIWYYRLKMVDTDTSFELSTARSINIGSVLAGVIYPNPAHGTLFLKDAAEVDRIYLYDKSGKVIKSLQTLEFNGIDVSDVYPGAYLVRVIYKNKKMEVFNVILNQN